MHFDEMYEDIGFGTIQRFTAACCVIITFAEGFLTTGLWLLTPFVACDKQLVWKEQGYLYIPFNIGHIIGSIVFGGVSDVSGRRSTLKGCCVICYTACMFATASPSFAIFEISSLALGLSLSGIQSGCRILLFETLPMNHRGSYVVIVDAVSVVGSLAAVVWVKYLALTHSAFAFSKPWQLFFFIGGLTSVIGSCFVGIIPFSIRQMLCHQRLVSVNVMLRKFYALNKFEHESTFPNYTFQPFINIETRHYRREQCSDYFVYHFQCLLSYIGSAISLPYVIPTLFLFSFHLCYSYGTSLLSSLVSEGIAESTCIYLHGQSQNNATFIAFCGDPSGYPSLENFYMLLSSLPAILILYLVADRVPRHLLLASSCVFASISAFLLIPNFQYSLQLPIALAFTFCHCIGLITLNILTLEFYPTKFRATAFGILKSSSRFTVLLLTLCYQTTCLRRYTFLYYATFVFILGAATATSYPNKNKQPILE